jgi:hypothetical protein
MHHTASSQGIRHRVAATSAALLLSGLGLAVGSSAASSSPAFAAAGPAAIGSSMASAGYEAMVSKASTASVKFVVPTITCTGSTTPIYLGVFLNGSMTAGGKTAGTGLFLGMYCSGTTAIYQATLNHDSIPGPAFAVKAGDAIVVDLDVGVAAESLTVTDTTSGTQRSDSSGTGIHPNVLQVTAQGGGGHGGFAPFSPVVYRSIVLNGAPLSAASPWGFKQIDSAHKVMIKTSGLQGAAADRFTLTYVRNS